MTRVHLVGVGGAGMSALARVLVQEGEVSGSDQQPSAALAALAALGVRVTVGHAAGNVDGAGIVVTSAAVTEANPEVEAARAAGIPVVSRAEMLARVVAGDRTVAVSGTHGKTTTSGMVATMVAAAGLDPTWLVGADIAGLGPGGHRGAGGVAVVEADEAYGSFLRLAPAIAVVTNLEEDHLDFYGSMTALTGAFERFASSASEVLVLCADDPGAAALAGSAAPAARVSTYGLGPADVTATSVQPGAAGSVYRLVVGGVPGPQVELGVGGRHNVLNSLGAAAAGLALGLPPEAVAAGLGAYRGAARRFEARGSFRGVALVDDYAHHPTEVAATLAAARGGPWARVLAVFQPHLYSRTKALWRAFGQALAGADVAVLTEIYGAREEPVPGVSAKLIVDAVCEARPGMRVAYLATLDQAAAYARAIARPGDLVLSLGAGDVTSLAGRILAAEAADS